MDGCQPRSVSVGKTDAASQGVGVAVSVAGPSPIPPPACRHAGEKTADNNDELRIRRRLGMRAAVARNGRMARLIGSRAYNDADWRPGTCCGLKPS
jgi:hypothetical protein